MERRGGCRRTLSTGFRHGGIIERILIGSWHPSHIERSVKMSEEDAFLRAIVASPRDTTLRLVYADWLDDRGDEECSRRAEYLRLECELDSLPSGDKRRRPIRERIGQLRQKLCDDWWEALDFASVDYCVEFEFQCEQRWDTLSVTHDPAVRHCQHCNQNVHYCRSAGQAYELAEAGECVAIDSRKTRLPLQTLMARAQQGRLLGRVAPRTPQRIPLPARGG